jgi:hypothetical protein
MTDYYPLLKRAVEGLEKNTGEARRAMYDRARSALLNQLRSSDPPLSEPEITRERLALEESVRRVEREEAGQARPASQPEQGGRKPLSRGNPQAPTGDQPGEQTPPIRPTSPAPPEPDGEAPGLAQTESPRPEIVRSSDAPPRPRVPLRPEPPQGRSRTPPAGGEPAPGPAGVGIKGFRDVVAEAESLGGASAEAARSARETYGSVRTGTPDIDRVEPRVGPDLPGPLPPARGRTPESEGASSSSANPAVPPTPTDLDEDQSWGRRRVPGPMPRRPAEFDTEEPPNHARRGMIAAIIVVVLIAALGGAAYWQRDRVSALFGVVKSTPTPQTQRDPQQTRPKSADRVGQESTPQPSQQQQQTPAGRPAAPPPAVAQRVVLYEEDPNNAEGNRYVGSALWRTETVSPGPGLAPELAIRADVEVPERRLAMTMSIRRNTDTALPASHTVEILFNLPADFSFGGVANVPGLLTKEAEQARGAPLSGLAVKVTNNFFLVGLSSADPDMQRNMQLLQERSWFDIPIVYNNGRRAILAVEKGNPGERAFTDAFATWKK